MDCKIKYLLEPINVSHPLDDWFIDCMYVHRRKVAIITHARTKFTFFIPYAEAGGAKMIPSYFISQLKELFNRNLLPSIAEEIEKLFNQEFMFTRTIDKKILGHMNDFKRCAEPLPDELYPINWQETAFRINNMPINASSKNCSFLLMQFKNLLGINLNNYLPTNA
jgi:hypothetical protein